uniref:Uncharacterized protein n=1 Tax=Anopheles melas TaxID=34690 RepID=A0A182ULI3_9DIPT
MEAIEMAPKTNLEDDHHREFVSRQMYDQLLEDYNKLKESKNTRTTTSELDHDVLEAYLTRINRFECLMRELQENFLQMKASVRASTLGNEPARKTHQCCRRDEGSAINYVMTIVHPKSRTN